MNRLIEVAVLTVIAAVVLNACTPTNSGPTPTSDSSPASMGSTTAAADRPTDRPAIPRALDASRYGDRERICELLSTSQATSLGFPVNDSSADSFGGLHSCKRGQTDLEDPARVYYSLYLELDLLSQTYAVSKDYAEFIPLTISGQPAVRIRTKVDGGEVPKACNVDLGLAERQGVEIYVTHDSRNACDLVVAVAEQMVRNLGG